MDELASKHGVTVRLEQDEDAPNPREDFDNAGTMVCWHRRYSLGDGFKNGKGKPPFANNEEFQEWWSENGEGGVILPLYLYDHSGITISTGPFSCPWDSGQVGWIYATAETIEKEWGKGKKTKDLALKCLEGEVETYDQYLTGDVYGYVIEDEDGEQLDSCWGFFGSEHAKKEALEAFERYARRPRRSAITSRQRARTLI